MVSEMKRVAVVVLLSIALVQVSGQVQAEAKGVRNVLQRSYDKMDGVAGRKSTFVTLFCATALCMGSASLMYTLGAGEHPITELLTSFSFPSTVFFSYSAFRNLSRQAREAVEAVKAVEEAYRSGVKDGFHHLVQKIEEEQFVVIDPGPVDVEDFDSLYDAMFDYIYTIKPSRAGGKRSAEMFSRADSPNPEVLMQVLPRLDKIVEENGGFPLRVGRNGLAFDRGVFISYAELFGEGNFRHRTQEDAPGEEANSADE